MNKLRLSIGLCLLLGVVGEAQSAWAQRPTVEQCRADQKLWLDKVKKLSQAERKADAESVIFQESISLKELTYRGLEMIDCKGLDPQFSDLYNKTSAEIGLVGARRMRRFLDRHDLYNQFQAEDAQGKR